MTLPFRQVHLDFHTSEKITPIAQDFDPERFARTLAEAHVNSVTCFSRCHHGMIYHDTRFEARHPGLSRNLLAEQIEACHRHGIRVPIYISVGWDEFQAKRHPEWLEVGVDGKLQGAAPLQAGWRKLCFNSPYIEYVLEQTQEVLENFPVDGFFFDIIHQGQCVCHSCLAGMLTQGLDPEREEHRVRYARSVLDRFCRRTTAMVRERHRECSIFYNAGHVSPVIRPVLDTFTHLELESLPSGGYGYDHFPLTVRYARNLGLDTLGMTGKFQKCWADFGGFKNPPALEHECFTALAEGSRCSIGDQLHPRGTLDPATYQLIGAVYRSVAEKEPWCQAARAVTEIAIFTPEAIGRQDGRVDSAAGGAYRMLLEAHHQFDVVDAESDWSRYRVLILPDRITLDEPLRQRVSDYLHGGGNLILSYKSGTDRETESHFVLDEMPVRLLGEARYSPDFVTPRETIAAHIPPSEHVMYERGLEVEPLADAEALADVWWPFFNRTWEHFCSHSHTPVERKSNFPAVVRRGRVIYFAHPIFGMFMRHGARTYKQLMLNTLALLLPDPLVQAEAPTTAHITLLHQPQDRRHVLHVLHYIPEHRYSDIHTIEDVLPLHNLRVGLRLPAPRRAYLAPSMAPLPFEGKDGRVWLTIPEVRGHAIVALEA
ncbi:MAG: beta-galactosidase trimerization domain-containing protein [Armatimonadetes bacterium]|nr:beta-galactosidase trimerization domain-containing protein [Armatimonadota bacterium]